MAAVTDPEPVLRELVDDIVWAWKTSDPPIPQHADPRRAERSEQLDAVGVARGWTSHVVRTGQLMESIELNRFSPLVAPLMRSMFEHVVGLAWLAEMRETAVDVLRKIQYDERQKMLQYEAGGWKLEEDTRAWLMGLTEPQMSEAGRAAQQYRSLRHQAELTGRQTTFQLWHSDSHATHARLETAGIHVHLDAEKNRYADHKQHDSAIGRLYLTAKFMIEAVYEYCRICGEESFEPRTIAEWLDRLDTTASAVNDLINSIDE